MGMDRWKHIVVWPDYIVIWHGLEKMGRRYRFTPKRNKWLKALLGDGIKESLAGEWWLWSWNDWDWEGIGERHDN